MSSYWLVTACDKWNRTIISARHESEAGARLEVETFREREDVMAVDVVHGGCLVACSLSHGLGRAG